MTRKPRGVQTGSIALGCLLVLALALWFLTAGPRAGRDSVATASPTASAPSAEDDARDVAEALQTLTSDPQSLMASGVPEMVEGTPDQALPPGATVTVDESSWAPDGIGGGTIVLTVAAPGEPEAPYLVVMVQESGLWKVLATLPVEEEA